VAEQLKVVAPAVPIIVGGPFATVNADRILRDCPHMDCVGIGEGEELLPDYLGNRHDPGSVAGLVWRDGTRIVQNRARPLIQDLDRFPYPDRSSLPIDYIESLPLDVPAVLSLDKFCTVQTSRGCPYSCIYCDIPSLSEGKWRCRSPENVLGELQELNDQGYRSIYLTDDHFLIKRERISAICHGIIERKLQFRWGCEGRVDSAAVDQLGLMSRANCSMLAFGVEAGSLWSDLLARRRRMFWRAFALPRGWSWTPLALTASVSIEAPRSGRNTWSAGSLTMSGIGRSGSSAPTSTRPLWAARRSTACA
jgi:radical SAM superfamily enzyme YgiQ (UPF0313 family)